MLIKALKIALVSFISSFIFCILFSLTPIFSLKAGVIISIVIAVISFICRLFTGDTDY